MYRSPLLFGGNRESAAPVVVVSDNFNGRSGHLAGDTPTTGLPGEVWNQANLGTTNGVSSNAEVDVVNNRLEKSVGFAGGYEIETSEPDCTISIRYDLAYFSGANRLGIVFRHTSGNDWFVAYLSDSGGTNCYIRKRVGGATDTNIYTLTGYTHSNSTGVAGSVGTMTVELSGTSITVTVAPDSGTTASYTFSDSHNSTATQHGIILRNGVIDDFELTV